MSAVFSANVATNGGTLTVTVPNASILANEAYYFAFDDPTLGGWQFDFAGPATVAGNILTFSLPPATFGALTTYGFDLYGISASATPPTPTPTSTPAGGSVAITVPTPAPVICSPSSDTVGVNQTNVIACTAQGYAGPFTVAVANPAIVSVQQSNTSTFEYFNVTGLEVGTTTVTFQSQPGGTGSVTITVAN